MLRRGSAQPGWARLTRESEQGFATVLALFWMVVVAVIAWLGLTASMIVAAQHHTDSAADLVALSAATRLQHGGDACSAAIEMAAANDVQLTACSVAGAEVRVEVNDVLRLPFAIEGNLRGIAVAGPE